MTPHVHWCTVADCYEPERCESARCAVTDDHVVEPYGPDRLCPKHARAAWVRVCEIVGAVVIAACVRDYAWALVEVDGTGASDIAYAEFDEARAALLGFASVEAMREAERR